MHPTRNSFLLAWMSAQVSPISTNALCLGVGGTRSLGCRAPSHHKLTDSISACAKGTPGWAAFHLQKGWMDRSSVLDKISKPYQRIDFLRNFKKEERVEWPLKEGLRNCPSNLVQHIQHRVFAYIHTSYSYYYDSLCIQRAVSFVGARNSRNCRNLSYITVIYRR